MKIGVITHHWVPNFGANLQVLATVSLLKHFGHEPYVINYCPSQLVEKYQKSIPGEQYKIHEEFRKEFLDQTELCSNAEEVKKENEKHDFDCLISGSDAVFRLDYRLNREDTTFPNPFWLSFAEPDQKRFFFSVSSMGTNFSTLEKSDTEGIKSILKDATITVRDKWTRDGLLNIDETLEITQTVDPVFLLDKYFQIPEQYQFHSDEPFILLNLYEGMLSDRWIRKFVDIANNKGYKVMIFPNPEGNDIGIEAADDIFNLPIHPLTWYSIMQQASGYIGVRFHPIVTAIANEIPFLSIDTYQTDYFNRFSSKTYDICHKTGNQKFCINRIQRMYLFPGRAFRLLMNHKTNKEFVTRERLKIEQVLGNLNFEKQKDPAES